MFVDGKSSSSSSSSSRTTSSTRNGVGSPVYQNGKSLLFSKDRLYSSGERRMQCGFVAFCHIEFMKIVLTIFCSTDRQQGGMRHELKFFILLIKFSSLLREA